MPPCGEPSPWSHRALRTAIGLVLAGALGNLIDRVNHGYVVDFLKLPHWPVFNVADIAIVAGAGILVLDMISRERRRAMART